MHEPKPGAMQFELIYTNIVVGYSVVFQDFLREKFEKDEFFCPLIVIEHIMDT